MQYQAAQRQYGVATGNTTIVQCDNTGSTAKIIAAVDSKMTPILCGKFQHNNDMVPKQATQQQNSEATAAPHKYSVAILATHQY